MSDSIRTETTGIILAGGRARRMGGLDKGLVMIHDRPMIAHVIDALRPQVAAVLINANRNRERYQRLGCAVVADQDGDYLGPLAGFAAGMRAARTKYVAVVPCDSPLLSGDLVRRLYRALAGAGARIAVAHDGERLQPVFALLERSLLGDLAGYLADGERKIDRWYERQGFATADCSEVAGSFRNINEPADQRALEEQLTARSQEPRTRFDHD